MEAEWRQMEAEWKQMEAEWKQMEAEGYKTLKEGAAVSFEPGDGEKGPVAKNIVNA